ncbi:MULTISPECIES: hypothetical protein [Streptomyces]|uniref:hypothetical protein n=1 Tax=Streptomyces TaxID=1883 RepID=UPI0019A636E4|nr:MULTISPECIES: hypothetical protein [Streptomyces]MCM3265926.1 hypothetical protein [Streptomyces thermoviolaceus]WTD48348.1 hypothetical protein OG899_12940 [Streptomyces thermoviolaceus]GGV72499.1 hypothetical protein GCM10010499_24660 [Streptomyces thermoviolaceus subsp. apingens]GHA87843.1 hypothetical protein GCM10010512_19080 [Streptomyces thermoviolaceus subsp. thermoviolaceus]
MAEGDGVDGRAIRIRLDANATKDDVTALKAWLEREKPLEDLIRQGRLRIVERPGSEGPPGQMGYFTDLLLEKAVDEGTEIVLALLLTQVRRAVKAWKDNRRRVERGTPPEEEVDLVRSDGE